MQFLQEWCHLTVFGLSENEFCSIVLDSVSMKSASMVIPQGWNCWSPAGMLRQMKGAGQLHSEPSMARLKLFSVLSMLHGIHR